MDKYGLSNLVVHAPYIINIANTTKPEVFQLGVDFLQNEIERTQALGAKDIVLHPGSHVGAGADKGIQQIIKGLNEVLTHDNDVRIALETMAGKGSEVGRTFEEIARSLMASHIMIDYQSVSIHVTLMMLDITLKRILMVY